MLIADVALDTTSPSPWMDRMALRILRWESDVAMLLFPLRRCAAASPLIAQLAASSGPLVNQMLPPGS